jgi:hypothetical protein
MRNARARFNKRMKRERELYMLGSHGAASEVRHIERADYQPPQPHVSVRPQPARQKQTKALLSAADTIQLADAIDALAQFGRRERILRFSFKYPLDRPLDTSRSFAHKCYLTWPMMR